MKSYQEQLEEIAEVKEIMDMTGYDHFRAEITRMKQQATIDIRSTETLHGMGNAQGRLYVIERMENFFDKIDDRAESLIETQKQLEG